MGMTETVEVTPEVRRAVMVELVESAIKERETERRRVVVLGAIGLAKLRMEPDELRDHARIARVESKLAGSSEGVMLIGLSRQIEVLLRDDSVATRNALEGVLTRGEINK